jgi:hypothetical protein
MHLGHTLAALSGLTLGALAQAEVEADVNLNFTVNSVQDSNYDSGGTCKSALCTVFVTEIRETTVRIAMISYMS